MLTVKDLRDSFLNFFNERDHRIVPSSPLIPKDDPTLLFATAGMVQFKPMFAGTVELEYTRAASIQKCFRTSDLENVGKTKRHCTFFEMLGNFSFGDYFKKGAIEYAWDYSIENIGFAKDDIWISIFENDDEAFEIWRKHIGVSGQKIVRLGKEDNFWGPAGNAGACGPCTELYFDRGPGYGCGDADCKPGCDCDRFLEYWNLVFNQFYQDETGKQVPLKQTGIDTGLGLERLAALVQDTESIYGTDEMKRMVNFVCQELKIEYTGENIVPIHVLVEHSRALTFSLADGAYPSNEGRGYVLRRLLRRALRYGRQIGVREPFLYKMVDPLVEVMAEYYPEIKTASPNIKNVIEGEENRFLETLENGMDRLTETIRLLKKNNEKMMSGKDAFVLYDTFGFPLEMTIEIAREEELVVNSEEFESEMEQQRERGKMSWKSGDTVLDKLFEDISKKAGVTGFTGYEKDSIESKVEILCKGNKQVDRLKKGEKGMLITKKTAFYGEAGGQVGDTGTILSGDSARFSVQNTKKINKTIVHVGEVVEGEFETGQDVTTEVDSVRRNLIRANHTVTHLMHSALRRVLGDHVHQTGSLVEPDRLRFDFTHFKGISDDELEEIETIINTRIWESLPVKTEEMEIDKATGMGAIAVFDEKYDNMVRVVSAGDFSVELCGGTHVDNTGKIGVFKILKEASPGAGMRRIEAVTLKGLLERYNAHDSIVSKLSERLSVPEQDIVKKMEDILSRVSQLEKDIKKIKSSELSSNVEDIIEEASMVDGTSVIAHAFDGTETKELRELSDTVRSRVQNSVVLFGSKSDAKAVLLYAATSKAVESGIDCGAIIKETVKLVGGGGGGRKDMAQAGGKTPDGLDDALKKAVEIAKKMIEG